MGDQQALRGDGQKELRVRACLLPGQGALSSPRAGTFWGGTWLGAPARDTGLSDSPGHCPLLRGHGFSAFPSALEPLSGISYNAVDGPIDRRSFHGAYVVQDGLPL